ncbi:YceI family protein [Flagellimonas meridianipacifica]|uniref:YceI-like domain-containing protein n=1 Tax=Flagellimonas meridianipacifica TaxID=1080225 RepID=A0A2T0MK80_9FLAO|nr:YceI family protein [Allomuricauda pacifica]PRX57906.1 YceI-like domain-containing protein [Allomuricauda pacifica]
MNRFLLLLALSLSQLCLGQAGERIITKQGQVSFFSHTSVEDIEATNNQVLSIVDFTSKEVAISMLMRAFVFKKALMQEHFNESYIESDIYPKCSFEGKILDLERPLPQEQTKLIKGNITIHGVSKELEIKTKIENDQDKISFSGTFNLTVADFKIKIPPIVAGNISKTIEVNFRFEEYLPYEN